MKRDSIFYKLFRQSPTLLFELLPKAPENANRYRFDSVAVKETKFEIDGVLLPPEGIIGTVFFIEVQFQKVETLCERLFAESALYFYRNCEKFSDWQAIIIYPSRSTGQSKLYPHRSLLNGEQVYRIYLDELGNIISVALIRNSGRVRPFLTLTHGLNPLQEQYINLLTAFGFKRVFGSEPNQQWLIDFVNTRLSSSLAC